MKDHIVGPFKVEVTFYLKNDQGQIGKAAYSMPVGRPVSMKQIAAAAPKTVEEVGNGFRWLTEQEFWDELVSEKYGRHIPTACPNDVDFDKVFKP